MKTIKRPAQIFLVLVPHRDIRFIMRKNSERLFNEGFYGAYQFPWVVPAALLSSGLSTDELKHCAASYRKITGTEKISTCKSAAVELTGGISLFGPQIEPSIPKIILNESAEGKIKDFIFPSVIGSCLFGEKINLPVPQLTSIEYLFSYENISFRAAAFANMYWQPLKSGDGAFGFKWKISRLSWLPKATQTLNLK